MIPLYKKGMDPLTPIFDARTPPFDPRTLPFNARTPPPPQNTL